MKILKDFVNINDKSIQSIKYLKVQFDFAEIPKFKRLFNHLIGVMESTIDFSYDWSYLATDSTLITA